MQLTMYSKICSFNFVLCNHFSFPCWYMYTLVCVILMLPLEVPWLENKMCSSIYWELFFLWFFPTTFFPMTYETFFSWLFLWLFFSFTNFLCYSCHTQQEISQFRSTKIMKLFLGFTNFEMYMANGDVSPYEWKILK